MVSLTKMFSITLILRLVKEEYLFTIDRYQGWGRVWGQLKNYSVLYKESLYKPNNGVYFLKWLPITILLKSG